MSKRFIITGGAGFIGFHLSRRLLEDGNQVVTLDNLNDYYDVNLKKDRLAILNAYPNFHFYKCELADRNALTDVFSTENIGAEDIIIHLAAQAGVRYSLENPDSYIQSNVIGFFNLLELAKGVKCPHFLYASSSSVYGGNTKLPFSTHDNVDHPVSLYAATKKTSELLAHVYSYTWGLPTTGLRFFTVYGPWGRPDMACYIFTKAILSGEAMTVFNKGDMFRDFTYVDDIVDGVVRLADQIPTGNTEWNGDDPDPASSWVPYKIYNIGNHKSVRLMDLIGILEKTLDRKAIIDFKPIQTGDVKSTFADIDDISNAVGFIPKTSIEEGLPKFVEWYKEYNNIS
ncbi:MAG: NAD-dependent epimerase [Calditrichaeota bacterium]|nr:NAD-dependent epimerase [Calditrichota bacterium]